MKQEISYEEASKKLDEILEKLESGCISLNESVKLFEEAEKLLSICAKNLNEAKGKILVIKNNIATIFNPEN